MDRTVADHRPQPRDLGQLAGDEGLPAEPRVDRHDADQVDQVQHLGHGLGGGGGVQRDPGLFPKRANGLQRAVQVGPGLDMGGDDVGPGLGEGIQVGVHRRDHQMHVHHAPDMRAQGRANALAEGQVRHEMAIHHVDMHPVGSLRLNRPAFRAKLGEIGGQDRRGDLDRAVDHRAGSTCASVS